MTNSRALANGRELLCLLAMIGLGCDASAPPARDAAGETQADAGVETEEADASAEAEETATGPDASQAEDAGLDVDPSDLDPLSPPDAVHVEPEDEAAYLFDPAQLRTYASPPSGCPGTTPASTASP